MNKNYAVIGGDLRIIELIKMFAKEENMVYIYGFENIENELKTLKNIEFCKTMEQAINSAQTVIAPIPFSIDKININAPYSKRNIKIEELITKLENKTFFTGNIQPEVYNLIPKSTKAIDIMKKEELIILNIIATAEGAIEIAISNTKKILQGSKTLIIGFGRIGKILAKKLEALSCKVTCSARKSEDMAWIQAYGYNYTNTNNLGENLSEYDIIINTVPHIILDKQKLEYIKPDALLLDLASKPGGIDYEYARMKGLNTVWALALPGKVAPVTTAKFIKEGIEGHF